MSGVNKCVFIGRLGKDPEIRHTENGLTVANFSLAVSEPYKDKQGNKVENTEWVSIVLWRGLAEVAEKYLRKGSQVFIEGKLKTRSYESNQGKRYVTEIVGDNLVMISGKSEGTVSEESEGYSDDLPC